MRLAIAQPCFGSSETVLRIKRSSVPWTKSFGFAILWLSTIRIVDCQGCSGCSWPAWDDLERTSIEKVSLGRTEKFHEARYWY